MVNMNYEGQVLKIYMLYSNLNQAIIKLRSRYVITFLESMNKCGFSAKNKKNSI
jgi:hypothetical protein